MGKRENFKKFLRAREKIELPKGKPLPQKDIHQLSEDHAGVSSFCRLVTPGQETATIRTGNAGMGYQVVSAGEEISKLNQIPIENQSALIKYRQNITVPAVWLGEQGIRVSNIPMIPAEKISNLNTYIQSRLLRVDGGNLDAR